ncbi:MAG TPA: TraB/GumN family protein, partial [Ramlibacter sp.]|nr:TraB/GumN family protein [Ramlibacter sp.]
KDGRVSWLYGTVHASRIEWVVPGPRIQAALAASDVIALELDPADPELARVFATPPDPARAQRVAAGLGPRIERLATRSCLPGEQMAQMRPMLQLAMLSLSEARRDGFHPELGVDAVLWGLARGQGKPVVALETPASQLAALTPASEADERAILERSVQDLESGESRPLLTRMLEAWAQGDAATLESYPQWCRCMDTPAERRFLRQMNDDRNEQIAGKLVALHGGGQRFFAAVGALHMTGPKALNLLLRAQGFQVQRVPFAAAR